MTPPLSPSRTPTISRSLVRAGRLARRHERLSRRIESFSRRLVKAQNMRLGAALIFCVTLVILAAQPRLKLELPAIIIFALAFSTLVIRTRRLDRHLRLLKALRIFVDRQEKRLRGLPSGRSWEPASRAAENLPLIRDLGLLGPHSLWTLLDETVTDGGQSRLLDWLSRQTGVQVDDVIRRQKAIQSLRPEAWFFTRLCLVGSSSDFRLSSSQILLFLKKPFVKERLGALLTLCLAVWVLALASIPILSHNHASIPPWPIAIFAGVNFFVLNRIGSQFKKGVGLSHHLDLLAPIFGVLERRLEKSSRLQPFAPVTKASGPSRQARKLNRVLAFMSVEGNPLVYLLANLVLPWSITATYFLERRRSKIAFSFPQCMEELADLEALGSLVIFDQYQTRTYPAVASGGRHPSLATQGVFHPLIDRSRVVANDFSFPGGKHLGLLTGSNMSGKSTFLRTLGVNQVLANIGAPVFAESLETCAFRIETCIEVSDSLRDGYSYFYAEVRRLKALLDAAEKSGEPTLILIDEIFRGTNNRERHIGSRAVIRTLAGLSQAVGFISTHDLELTQTETTYESVVNFHFREEFSESGEMVFSYLIHRGPCPTTNALKIMAAEGLQVDLA